MTLLATLSRVVYSLGTLHPPPAASSSIYLYAFKTDLCVAKGDSAAHSVPQRCLSVSSSSVSCIFNLVATHTHHHTHTLPRHAHLAAADAPAFTANASSMNFSLVLVARSEAATHQLVEARLMWHVANEFLPTAMAQPSSFSLSLQLATSCCCCSSF